MIAGVIAAAVVGLAAGPVAAHAATGWSGPYPGDQSGGQKPVGYYEGGQPITGIACPSSTQCTAVDGIGQEVTFNPGSITRPLPVPISRELAFTSVACAGASRCVALDAQSGQAVSFDPADPSGARTLSLEPSGGVAPVIADPVRCPTAQECVVVDSSGRALRFHPASLAAPVPIALTSDAYLGGLSCPDATHCFATDTSPDTTSAHLVSFNPETGAETTAAAGVYPPMVCPTTSECVAGSATTGPFAFVAFDPSRPSVTTTTQVVEPAPDAPVSGLDCSSPIRCSVTISAGAASFDPQKGGGALPEGIGADPTTVACPSDVRCVAGTTDGLAVIYRPIFLLYAPRVLPIDVGGSVTAVSCPTRGQCTAVDAQGYEATVSPYLPSLTSSFDLGSVPGGATSLTGAGVACPSTTQCTGVSQDGTLRTFNPHATSSAGPMIYVSGLSRSDALVAIACPSAAQCTTVSRQGAVGTFDPATAATGPAMTVIDALGGSDTVTGAACLATNLCVLVDSLGRAVTFDPATPSGASIATIAAGAALLNLSCPTATQCTTLAGGGRELTFNPAAPGHPTPATVGTGADLTALSCATATTCVALGPAGEADTFNPMAPAGATHVVIDPLRDHLSVIDCTTAQRCAAFDSLDGQMFLRTS